MSTDLLGVKIQRFLADLKEKEKRVNRGDDAFSWEFLVKTNKQDLACQSFVLGLKSFSAFLKKIRIDSDDFRETSEFSTEIGSRTVNQKKNRYRDILPCKICFSFCPFSNEFSKVYLLSVDSCRVKLTPYADDNDSDYINASFINVSREKL